MYSKLIIQLHHSNIRKLDNENIYINQKVKKIILFFNKKPYLLIYLFLFSFIINISHKALIFLSVTEISW